MTRKAKKKETLSPREQAGPRYCIMGVKYARIGAAVYTDQDVIDEALALLLEANGYKVKKIDE